VTAVGQWSKPLKEVQSTVEEVQNAAGIQSPVRLQCVIWVELSANHPISMVNGAARSKFTTMTRESLPPLQRVSSVVAAVTRVSWE